MSFAFFRMCTVSTVTNLVRLIIIMFRTKEKGPVNFVDQELLKLYIKRIFLKKMLEFVVNNCVINLNKLNKIVVFHQS